MDAYMKKAFTVVGGDLRQGCLANLLAEAGYRVHALCMGGCEELKNTIICSDDIDGVLPQSDVVIFPLPMTVDEVLLNAPFCAHPPLLAHCLQAVSPFAHVLGGMVGEHLQNLAQQLGLVIQDYYAREELIVLNCIPTAEGALSIAMQETAKTIFGSRCLITGFGRVSKALARLLLACGAKVSIAARKQGDLAYIRSMGADPIPMAQLKGVASRSDVIFNTVPARLFGESILSGIRKESLIIDLASKPGGVSEKNTPHICVLPAKATPRTVEHTVQPVHCRWHPALPLDRVMKLPCRFGMSDDAHRDAVLVYLSNL